MTTNTTSIQEPEDLKAIAQALRIVKNDNFPIEIRRILGSLLKSINDLNTSLEDLKKESSVGAVLKSFTTQSLTIEDKQADIIEQVKNYLSQTLAEKYFKEKTEDDRKDIEAAIENYITNNNLTIEGMSIGETVKQVIKSVLGWDILDDIMTGRDKVFGDFEEIQIDDFKDVNILVGGKLVNSGLEFKSPQHLRQFVNKLILEAGKSQAAVPNVTEKSPFVRVRIGDSTRVSIMGGGIARRGPGIANGEVLQVCIRKQKSDPITIEKLMKWGSIDEYGCMLLKYALSHGVSVCAFGGTGSGKTASLRAFFEYLPDDLRVITMAETDEMNLRKVDMEPYIVLERDAKGNPTKYKLDSNGNKMANPNYKKAINSVLMWEMPDLTREIMPGKAGFVGGVNASLTFTPEMIILQESKGGEIKDVVEEAISGHQVCTTIHVNNSAAVPMRILLMFQQSGTNISDDLVLKQVPEAFPWLVFFKRLKDGSRKIFEISELMGFDSVTKEAKIRPLLIYNIISQTKEKDKATGRDKYHIVGEHKAVFNPIDNSKGYRIMRENGLTDEETELLRKAYEQRKPSSDILAEYSEKYGVTK